MPTKLCSSFKGLECKLPLETTVNGSEGKPKAEVKVFVCSEQGWGRVRRGELGGTDESSSWGPAGRQAGRQAGSCSKGCSPHPGWGAGKREAAPATGVPMFYFQVS